MKKGAKCFNQIQNRWEWKATLFSLLKPQKKAGAMEGFDDFEFFRFCDGWVLVLSFPAMVFGLGVFFRFFDLIPCHFLMAAGFLGILLSNFNSKITSPFFMELIPCGVTLEVWLLLNWPVMM